MTIDHNTLIQNSIQCFPGKPTKRFKNLEGQIFGILEIISFAGYEKDGGAVWICSCECDNLKLIRSKHLITGRIKSCGCRQFSSGGEHRLKSQNPDGHGSWLAIKTRCYQPTSRNWKYYGGRGIRACSAIRSSFWYFIEIIGPKPTPKHQVDRKDTEGHYSCGKCEECTANGWPKNIRWLTHKENQMNKRRQHGE